jgi:hypothetical protein
MLKLLYPEEVMCYEYTYIYVELYVCMTRRDYSDKGSIIQISTSLN